MGLIKATFQIIHEAINDGREKHTFSTICLWEVLTGKLLLDFIIIMIIVIPENYFQSILISIFYLFFFF